MALYSRSFELHVLDVVYKLSSYGPSVGLSYLWRYPGLFVKYTYYENVETLLTKCLLTLYNILANFMNDIIF